MDTLGFEPRAFRMQSGCDTTTPCARLCFEPSVITALGRHDTSEEFFAQITTYPERRTAALVVTRPLRELAWTHWDLNPGPSACEADVIPLHHVPPCFSISHKAAGVFLVSRCGCGKACRALEKKTILDTLGIEPRAFRMQSGCDTATPCAHLHSASRMPIADTPTDGHGPAHKGFKASRSAFTRVSYPALMQMGQQQLRRATLSAVVFHSCA